MACLIATHPLHVCTVRAVAQFVGKEDKYDGVLGAIVAIYKEDGILGKPILSGTVYTGRNSEPWQARQSNSGVACVVTEFLQV